MTIQQSLKTVSSMRPRRLLLFVAPLPTITETHEDTPQLGCSTHPSQSLEEYINSIKELAQPCCRPVRVTRTQRPRLLSKALAKHSTSSSSSTPRSSSRLFRPRTASLSSNDATLNFSGQRDYGTKDPVDWLFAQTQMLTRCEDLCNSESVPASLRLI
ncbi:protein DEPP [Chanos chanos]|uniref:Protein DEPP n=1 Tax=Chanos chanos TaxID=29144 RepID=A0A6J2V4J6_CHACN|nr:protein DEPP1 [Chanos chanos]